MYQITALETILYDNFRSSIFLRCILLLLNYLIYIIDDNFRMFFFRYDGNAFVNVFYGARV